MDFHKELQERGIRHYCHYNNPWSVSDLGMAALMCTECRLHREEFTIDDIVSGKIDPLDIKYAIDRQARLYNEERQDRIDGKKKWHTIHFPTIDNERNPEHGKTYERADCFEKHGSGAVPENRICVFCKKSVDT